MQLQSAPAAKELGANEIRPISQVKRISHGALFQRRGHQAEDPLGQEVRRPDGGPVAQGLLLLLLLPHGRPGRRRQEGVGGRGQAGREGGRLRPARRWPGPPGALGKEEQGAAEAQRRVEVDRRGDCGKSLPGGMFTALPNCKLAYYIV